MKRLYPLLSAVLLALSSPAASAQSMAWRPFRPGLIYAYSAPGNNSAHTLRLDSAYVTTAGDSAWTFNRLVKTSNGIEQSVNPYGFYRKSSNNLFGARLTRQLAPAGFTLENIAEGTFQTAVALQLRPQAAIGSTWMASTAPLRTATLTSRSQQLVGTGSGAVLDSVATITLNTGQVFRLSRTYGLLEAPQWLTVSGSSWVQRIQARLPMTIAQSPYNPTQLFNLQPNDELGYLEQPLSLSPFPSSESYILRRILTRQQNADSLIYTYQEQRRTQNFATPTGGTASVQTFPIQLKRWAFSLRTGQSPQFPALPLLTGEYLAAGSVTQPPLFAGRGILVNNNGSGCVPSGEYLGSIKLFPGPIFNTPIGQYSTGIDIGWRQEFPLALGLGATLTEDARLDYYSRRLNSTTSTPVTCGSRSSFLNLLATRATQAAAIATLHPNPATEQATLTFTAPNRAAATLTLTDALGRQVWQAPVNQGQTTAIVPLAGRPAGLYLVQLKAADMVPITWKLTHE